MGIWQLHEQDLQHIESAVGLLLFGVIVGIVLALILNKLLDE
jgi:tetrahydromethanopterin S-methyltransferase subunit G